MADILVIGIGNLILGDDAVGPLAVRELSRRLAGFSRVIHFIENYTWGLDLLNEISGYRTVMIIDSLVYDKLSPGECLEFSLDELKDVEYGSFAGSHDLNLPLLWKLGNRLQMEMPGECIIYGIVIDNLYEFSDELSDIIKSSFNDTVSDIEKKLIELISPVHQGL
jgi:hydrogenase maturation protease